MKKKKNNVISLKAVKERARKGKIFLDLFNAPDETAFLVLMLLCI